MKIPFLDLKAQFKAIQDEIQKKISDVVISQQFILGPEVEAFEKEMMAFTQTKYAVGVSSGSDALIASLMALGIGDGDAVITTPFTFFATAGAVVRLGAVPVFCDIDEQSFNIDPSKMEEVIAKEIRRQRGPRLKAVLPVHLYGQCADMAPILDLSRKYLLFVIEDAAQAVGAEYIYEGAARKACTFGHLGILSFYPSKNLSAFGDGGMILTDSEDLAAKLKVLREHGSRDRYYHDVVGGNFRLDALQAAVLRVKLKHLDSWQKMRRDRASCYDRLFQEAGLLEKKVLRLPKAVYKKDGIENFHTYHQYVVRVKKRDDLKQFLKEKGIATSIYYPLPLHLQKCFSDLGYKRGDFPEAEKASAEVLALPIYPELRSDQQEYVVSVISQFYSMLQR